MAELKISSEEIRDALAQFRDSYDPNATRSEVGAVVEAADGIARVSGLPSVCLLYTSPSPRDQRGSRMPSSA